MIDWTKPVTTRDGRKVRVLCTDGPGKYPVIGIVEDAVRPVVDRWMQNGKAISDPGDDELDLINDPEPAVEIRIGADMNVDFTKPLEWSAGKCPARYLGTLTGAITPLYRHVIAVDYPSMEQVRLVDDRGFDKDKWTVINTPGPAVEIVRWVNIYDRGTDICDVIYNSKEMADAVADALRIACVPITIRYRRGEGL